MSHTGGAAKKKFQFDFCDFSGETPDARVRWLRHKCWSYQMSIITEAIKVEFNTCVKIQEHPDMLSCPKFIPIFTIVLMFSRPKVRLCPHALLAYLKILNAIENVNRLFSHPSCYQLCRGDVEGGVPNLGKQNMGNKIPPDSNVILIRLQLTQVVFNFTTFQRGMFSCLSIQLSTFDFCFNWTHLNSWQLRGKEFSGWSLVCIHMIIHI